MSIIDRIITTARQKGYTQVALADALKEHHVTKQTITDWKAGKSGTYFMLIPEFAALLDVSADYLLTGKTMPADEERLQSDFRLLDDGGKNELFELLDKLTQGAKLQKLLEKFAVSEADEPEPEESEALLTPDFRKKVMELLEDDDF